MAQGNAMRDQAHSVQVSKIFPHVKRLSPVEANLLAAWLEHVIATDMPLQYVLGMAPAAEHTCIDFRTGQQVFHLTLTRL